MADPFLEMETRSLIKCGIQILRGVLWLLISPNQVNHMILIRKQTEANSFQIHLFNLELRGKAIKIPTCSIQRGTLKQFKNQQCSRKNKEKGCKTLIQPRM